MRMRPGQATTTIRFDSGEEFFKKRVDECKTSAILLLTRVSETFRIQRLRDLTFWSRASN